MEENETKVLWKVTRYNDIDIPGFILKGNEKLPRDF